MPTDRPSGEPNCDATPKPGAADFERYISLIESWLHEIIARSPFKLHFSLQKPSAQAEDAEELEYVVDFAGADADLLLEKNATLLHALEHLALKAIRLDEEHVHRIAFECQDWRRTRMEELRLMARVAAERVIETGAPFVLNPMNPRERRIVHLALKDQRQVRTQSEGKGAERQVVIFPAKTSGN